MSMSERFMSNSSPSCSSVGAFKMSSSSVVDAVVELGEDREEAVDQRTHVRYTMTIWGDAASLAWCRSMRSRTCASGRALFSPVHRHDVAVRPEAMHLGVPGVLGVGTAGDEVHEPVVVVDPRPLVETLRRLDGERVELEVDAQQLRHRAVRGLVVEVQPEELGARQRREHVLRRGRLILGVDAQRPLQRDSGSSTAPVSRPRSGAVGWRGSRG